MVIRITDPNTDPDPDPYRDTGKTCLGAGMHRPSVSSLLNVVGIPGKAFDFQNVYACLVNLGTNAKVCEPHTF